MFVESAITSLVKSKHGVDFKMYRYSTRSICIAPCKGIRIPESRNFLPLESGILSIGIRNPALRIRNPTKDWNPESNLIKIHYRLN